MIPANSTALPVAQGGQTPSNGAGQAKPDTAVSGQSKASVGVAAPANLRAETTQAVDASRQTTVSPRLRDQENAERNPRLQGDLTGPPPSFDETPLQKASRVIFDPPEAFLEMAAQIEADIESVEPETVEDPGTPSLDPEPPRATEPEPEPRPEPRSDTRDERAERQEAAARQAETAFAEAKKLEESEAKGLDVAY